MPESFTPRPAQKDILAYRGGTMGVSAVPGSGKTWTLSLLAAELIRNRCITDDQEILVVTLVNSAVHNFSQRISNFLDDFGLIPSLGYRVRTLHGLAHDIVNERPELAGLDNGFSIIDERESSRIREDAVLSWLNKNPAAIDNFLIPDLSDSRLSDLRQDQIPALFNQISLQFIRTAKNLGLSPADIVNHPLLSNIQFPLFRFGLEIYQDYQKNLSFRGAVDFDDLIIKAHKVLSLDKSLLLRLQQSWPYILEDESQDSSLLQQKILSMLSDQGSSCNWVRVGDPNQAIYETFTTADPLLLREFISRADFSYKLPNSGRSTTDIIRLANYLVEWSNNNHPNITARDALFPNYIQPTPAGDTQPNPPSEPGQIHLYGQKLNSEEELHLLARSVTKWLGINPDSTVAILSPRNERGKKMASLLRDEYGVEPVELLSSSLATRKTIGALANIISSLIDPGSSKKLGVAFNVFHRENRSDPEIWSAITDLANLINTISEPETFLAPRPGRDWLDSIPEKYQSFRNYLVDFKSSMLKWQDAAQLPIDQLIMTISSEIFTEPAAQALSHMLASHVKLLSNSHPAWGLSAFLDELRALARNERRFYSSGDEGQFNPDDHKGKVVVTTAHKAKGLEWDRVYLMSANNYNFPAGDDGDIYIAEKWFIRDNLNLPAETIACLDYLADPEKSYPVEGTASVTARDEYIRERLRLFYVSITRAKRELIITWNTGRSGKCIPCKALNALINETNSKGDGL
jgi:DNA helicase-2/ATP-dependent DNA helicase PcrA